MKLEKDPGRRRLIAAALAGALVAPLVCVWVFRTEILYNSADLASSALSFAAVGVLLLLVLLRFFLPRVNRKEVILIYAAVAGTVGISTMGMVQFLITTVLAPFWFSTPENRWSEFWGSIPSWAAPRSYEAVQGFFLGNSSLYRHEILHAWLVPVLFWSVFILALLASQYCLAHLMYPRWSKDEKLTFPIVQLPLSLTEDARAGRPALIAGAVAAVAVQGMNALHYSFPSVPEMRVLPVEVSGAIPAPWNGVGTLWVTFYPCIIGLSILVPTNILFSSVFFFAATKLENMLGHMYALNGAGTAGFPHAGEQAQGAMLALALVILWSARGRLISSVRNRSDTGAWAGLVVSLGVLFAFALSLGVRTWVAASFLAVFFLFMLSIGWLRAAIGLVWNPGTDVGWWARAVGGANMPIGEGVGLAYMRWFSFGDFRAHALPAYVDMMRLGESSKIKRKYLFLALLVGSLLSVYASLWVALDVYYRHGAATVMTHQWRTYQGRAAFDILRSQLDGVSPGPGAPQAFAASFGFLLVLLLHAANGRFLWWPFHAAGFVAAQTGSLEWLWLPMAIAGAAKVLLLRVGGLKLYRRAVPFFLGLVLGDYALSIILAILSCILHVPLYKPFPIS